MDREPRTQRGWRTRARVIDAAREVFGRDGFVEARMSDIAGAAGVSIGGLYRYFVDKEDVFSALVSDLHEEVLKASEYTAEEFALDPLKTLVRANTGYFTVYSGYADVMRSFTEAVAVDARFREAWWAMRRNHVRRFMNALEALPDTAAVPDLELVAEAIACLVEQCAYVWFAQARFGDRPVSVDEAANAVSFISYRTLFSGAHALSGRDGAVPAAPGMPGSNVLA